MGLFQSKTPAPSSSLFTPSPVASAPRPSSGLSVSRILVLVAGALILGYIALTLYNFFRTKRKQAPITLTGDTSSGDQLPTPADGKKRTIISSVNSAVGTGIDYGVQFWMFVNDWDYNFTKEKTVLVRSNPTQKSPNITLHPTDNSLNVQVAIYPNDQTAGAAVPEAGTTGDSFTCTVENIPLQAWFSVSVTVFQRNLDIYINGRLVKSCVLPGVPKPISGDILVGDERNGFSGSVCNVHTYLGMLTPEDAKSFFDKGTGCLAPAPTKTGVDEDSLFITLFGYTFKLSKLNKQGEEVSSYTF